MIDTRTSTDHERVAGSDSSEPNGWTPRVLLSAYQCAPGLGSVSQIGWEWYSRLARRTPVTLVTHIRNRAPLEAAGAPTVGSEIIFIDTEWFAGPLYRIASRLFPKSQHAVFLLASLDFYVYDRQALRTLRNRFRGQWDVVHAPTPVSPVAATTLFRLGPPLVVGPWNGGMVSPGGFAQIMREDSGWIYRIRYLGRLIDRLIGCTKNAALILSATTATDESVPAPSHNRTRRMIENGVDLSLFRPGCWDPPPSARDPLRVLFVGRLLPFKGVSMLLQAVARVKNEINLRLTVVGDGPLRESLTHEAAELGLESIVSFAGNLPLAAVSEHMRNSHLFCLPSIRESGGAVLLEAMACATPAVAVNYGGPAEILNDRIGRLLPSGNPESVISSLAEVMRDVFHNPSVWRAKGRAGEQRMRAEFDWDAKIASALKLYREVAIDRKAA